MAEGGGQLPLSTPNNAPLPGTPPVDGRPNIQVFKTPGAFTWTKPDGCTHVDVICIGAGGGGGSGRKQASDTSNSHGGGGGQGGGVSRHSFDASILDDTVDGVIGAGGVGGVSVSGATTNGNDGVNGGNSSFGTFLQAQGGAKGKGGTAAGVAAATGKGIGNVSTGTNGAGQSPPLQAGDATGFAPTGGGGGGFNGGGSTASDGGSFIAANGAMLPIDLLGGAHGVASIGGNGSDAPTNYMGGTGGGGGATSATTRFNGGRGGYPGGGGGGGNTGLNSVFDSGFGGQGGDGLVAVISYR